MPSSCHPRQALTSSATNLLWVPIARTSIFLPSFLPSLPSFLTVQFRGPPVPHLIHSLTHPLHLTALCTYPWPWRRPAPPWPSPRTPSLEEQIERRCMHDCLFERESLNHCRHLRKYTKVTKIDIPNINMYVNMFRLFESHQPY